LGSNGAGKTTLLKLIGGLLYPTEGNILINGYDTVKDNLKARQMVGFVLNEERSFYWRLTGRQNLSFFGHLDNLYGSVLDNKIIDLIHLVGLDEAADRHFSTYSSGMKQRLAIARGLMSDPGILILDEPTRTLDPIASEEMRSLITKKVHNYFEKTIFIATHRLDEAEALCDKICIMAKGQILLYQDKNEILSEFGSLENCYRYTLKDYVTTTSSIAQDVTI
jgi:ABC-2 type transport system ATP-binding protein